MAQTRRARNPLPLTKGGCKGLEAFQECIRCWPLEITGWNYRTNKIELRKINLGSTAIAERNFSQLVEEGHATPRQLYACAWIASKTWRQEGYIWVPHLATFFGPEKEIWANFLDDANKLVEEQDMTIEMPEINPSEGACAPAQTDYIEPCETIQEGSVN